jgi:hypothetical protein
MQKNYTIHRNLLLYEPVVDQGPRHYQGETSLRVFTTIGTVAYKNSRGIRKHSYVNENDQASKNGWA